MKSHTITFIAVDPFFTQDDVKRALSKAGYDVQAFVSADGTSPVVFQVSETKEETDQSIPPSLW